MTNQDRQAAWDRVADELREYISSAAEKFAPGNFVTTWNGTANVVGATLAIKDPQEANPLIQVKWIPSLDVEWIRAEYLYLAT